MRPKIGYLTFGRDDFGYGLALCLSELKNCDLYRVTPKTARFVDWLVFSAFWWEHAYVLADFLRKAGIDKRQAKRPKIIVGGFNTINPVTFYPYADYVVVGDGEGALKAIIEDGGPPPPNVLCEGRDRVTYGTVPELRPYCHETNEVGRIEVARGCRFICSFCAVSHLKRYRELSLEGVQEALKSTKRRMVALFAPEPTAHSQDEAITRLCHNLGKTRCDSDVRLDRLEKRQDSVPRVGIEGLSERLRKSVRKYYSNEKIIEAVRAAISAGRRGIFMYIILDLPGEAEEDWDEFRGLLERIGKLPGAENFVLKPSPSVFMPQPGTPMALEGINWRRDYGAKWESFFGRGDDREWEVIMAERSRVFSGAMRVLSMVSTRAGEEFKDIDRLAAHNGAIAIAGERPVVRDLKTLLAVLDKFGGVDHYCGPRKGGPWEIVQAPDAHPRKGKSVA